MNFNEYQIEARKTAIYPNMNMSHSLALAYLGLGLTGEAGECAEKIKKLIRDKDGVITEEFKDNLILEISDIMWYMSNLCSELNIPLETVAYKNLEKLKSRAERNMLKGSGDNR